MPRRSKAYGLRARAANEGHDRERAAMVELDLRRRPKRKGGLAPHGDLADRAPWLRSKGAG